MPGTWPLVGRREELEFIERAPARPDQAGVVLAGEAGVMTNQRPPDDRSSPRPR